MSQEEMYPNSIRLHSHRQEIWCGDLDSLCYQSAQSKNRFIQEFARFRAASNMTCMVLNLEEIYVDEDFAGVIAAEISSIPERHVKIAFVGLDPKSQRHIIVSLTSWQVRVSYDFFPIAPLAEKWFSEEPEGSIMRI